MAGEPTDRSVHVAASILNADLTNLGQICRDVEAAGADSIQVDVMDGHFVPALSFGPEITATVVRNTSLPVEAHLMVERPAQFIEVFAGAGARDFIFHIEVADDFDGLAAAVTKSGMRVGVAIKYETPLELLLPHVAKVHLVVFMGIEPGKGGQAFNPLSLPALSRLRREVQERGLGTQIQVDGGMNDVTAPTVIEAGADALVAGSFLFRHPGGYADAINRLKMAGRGSR